MAEQVIGVARVDITVDPSGAEVGAACAKASIASMSKDAQAQYSRLTATQKRNYDSLARQADMVGLSKAGQIDYNAQLKASGLLLDEFTKRLGANTVAAEKAGIQFNKYGVSAKQTEAALRQVPAQLTDIIVSLQGGQAPLTVLLQQGGQLRDIFGGVVPAAKAMDDLNKTLTMTGNALGVMSGQAADMASSMSKMAGITRSDAIDALTEVVKSGKIAGDQIESVASIARVLTRLVGPVILARDAALRDLATVRGDLDGMLRAHGCAPKNTSASRRPDDSGPCWIGGFAACYGEYAELATDAARWADQVNGLQGYVRAIQRAPQ